MKQAKAVLALSMILLSTAASAPALAWGHGGVRFGVVIGAPFYPWYYPPYYSYPPYYYYPSAPATPQTYVEQGDPQAAPGQQSYWYYCAESKTYYPYVKECPGGWQRVTPQPAK
jgi:hypothetical protein